MPTSSMPLTLTYTPESQDWVHSTFPPYHLVLLQPHALPLWVFGLPAIVDFQLSSWLFCSCCRRPSGRERQTNTTAMSWSAWWCLWRSVAELLSPFLRAAGPCKRAPTAEAWRRGPGALCRFWGGLCCLLPPLPPPERLSPVPETGPDPQLPHVSVSCNCSPPGATQTSATQTRATHDALQFLPNTPGPAFGVHPLPLSLSFIPQSK